MGFLSPPKPPAPPLPPPIPAPEGIDAAAIARQNAADARKRRGRQSLIIGGDTGLNTNSGSSGNSTGLSIPQY